MVARPRTSSASRAGSASASRAAIAASRRAAFAVAAFGSHAARRRLCALGAARRPSARRSGRAPRRRDRRRTARCASRGRRLRRPRAGGTAARRRRRWRGRCREFVQRTRSASERRREDVVDAVGDVVGELEQGASARQQRFAPRARTRSRRSGGRRTRWRARTPWRSDRGRAVASSAATERAVAAARARAGPSGRSSA